MLFEIDLLFILRQVHWYCIMPALRGVLGVALNGEDGALRKSLATPWPPALGLPRLVINTSRPSFIDPASKRKSIEK